MVGAAMITVLIAQMTAFDGCSLIQAMDRAAIRRIFVTICPILAVAVLRRQGEAWNRMTEKISYSIDKVPQKLSSNGNDITGVSAVSIS